MKNKDIVFLYTVLSNTPLKAFDEEIRVDCYKLKNQLESTYKIYQNERIFIFLINEGIEKKEQNGGTSIIMPELTVRANYTGSDEKYKVEVQKILNIRNKIENEIDILNNKQSTLKIEKIFTSEQFDKIGDDLNLPLDWEELREKLVKTKK